MGLAFKTLVHVIANTQIHKGMMMVCFHKCGAPQNTFSWVVSPFAHICTYLHVRHLSLTLCLFPPSRSACQAALLQSLRAGDAGGFNGLAAALEVETVLHGSMERVDPVPSLSLSLSLSLVFLSWGGRGGTGGREDQTAGLG